MGKKKAIIAIAHKLLTVTYVLLKKDIAYAEYGEKIMDEETQKKRINSLRKQLENYGLRVTIEEISQNDAIAQ